jgi:hypothetical protein
MAVAVSVGFIGVDNMGTPKAAGAAREVVER